MLLREQRISSRSSSSSAVGRRESLFDLLFLLRRGSSKPKKDNHIIEELPKSVELFENELEEEDKCIHTREELMEKIREKKAVIENLRCQPWPMQRKLRTLRLAQRYLQRQEARVSRSHLLRESIQRHWKSVCRWFANFSIYLIPWEAKIKKIESHFGSVVSSYFIFLRWIFGINLIISLIMIFFIAMPECIADSIANEYRRNITASRKELTEKELETADHLQTVWDFKGYLARSALFYGYYMNEEYVHILFNYRLPLAYFLVNLFVLGYSFFAILRKMAANARTSKLTSGKTEQYVFSWKVSTGWDYSIGNPETASNAIMANVTKFRESIMEHKEKQAETFKWIRFFLRILANVIILGMMACSTYAIYMVVERSREIEHDPTSSALQKIEVPIVVSFITLVFPNLFEMVSKLERFHPRMALRLQLGRILVLYFLNFYTLIFAIFTKMEYLIDVQESLREMHFDLAISNSTDAQLSSGQELPADFQVFRVVRDVWKAIASGASNVVDSPAMTTAAPIPFFHLIPKEFFTNRFLPNAQSVWQRRLVEAKTKSSPKIPLQPAGELKSEQQHPGLTWTTIHPEYGLLGVDNLHAFLINGTVYKDLAELELFLKKNNITIQLALPKGNESKEGLPPSSGTVFLIPQKLSSVELESLCWETMIGEEIAKLVTMDLVMNIASILTIDFLRGLWVRFCTNWWCWNLETGFPEYGEFKVAENVLHVMYNQGMIWLGMFFSPLLPAVNIFKLIILMYTRAWAVMTCNIPATEVFRASKSSNFYFLLLLLIMFLCVLPVGYVIASKEPSSTCGPFAGKSHFYTIITDQLKALLPAEVYSKMNFLSSPGIVIPVLILFILVIYFLISLVRGLKEANDDLNKQLFQERTEEKRKIFKMAGTVLDRKRNKYPPPAVEKDKHASSRKGSLSSLKRFMSRSSRDVEEDVATTNQKQRAQPTLWMNPLHQVHRESSQSFYVPSLKSLPEESDQEEAAGTFINRSKSDSHLKKEVRLKSAYSRNKACSAEEKDLEKGLSETSEEPTKVWTETEGAVAKGGRQKYEKAKKEGRRKIPKQTSLEMVELIPKEDAAYRRQGGVFKPSPETDHLLNRLEDEEDISEDDQWVNKKKTKREKPEEKEAPQKMKREPSFENFTSEGEDYSAATSTTSTDSTPVIKPWPALEPSKLKPILKRPDKASTVHKLKPRLIIAVTPTVSPTPSPAHKRYIIRQRPGPKFVESQSSADAEEESLTSSTSDRETLPDLGRDAQGPLSSGSSDESPTLVEDKPLVIMDSDEKRKVTKKRADVGKSKNVEPNAPARPRRRQRKGK